jgi:NTP pyrophosphatase (non-canonical NTP hydrolase)
MQHENTLEALEQLVVEWAADKGIFAKATAYKQAEKTLEECGELLHAIGMQTVASRYDEGDLQQATDEVKDALGDIFVTIIIGAHMQGFTIGQCLQSAYDVIAKRKGQMINGKFVKDA